MTSLLMSSPPISISHWLFRCKYSNSRDVVASSFSRPDAKASQRACSQAKIRIKYNTRTFLDFFTAIKCICQPILAFLQTEMTLFATFSLTSTSEILTLSYAWGLKKIPLSGGAFLGPNPRFLRVAMQGWSDWHKNGRGSSSPFPALAPQYARYTLPLSCCA